MRSFIFTSRGRLVAAALAALVLPGAARAQYPQYGAPYSQPYAQPAPAYAQSQVYGQPAVPQYGAAYQGYQPNVQYQAPRVAMAYQTPASSGENLPLSAPSESVAPGMPQANGNYVPAASVETYGTPAPTPGYPAPAPAGCSTCQTGGYESYPAAAPAAGCDATAYGSCNSGYSTYGGSCAPGSMAYAAGRFGGSGYWFGGAYGLLMDRDSSNKYALAFVTDPSMPTAYPPQNMNIVMTTRDVDVGFQPGVEFRLGRAFGGGCDPCGCACGGPQWGLEGVYWILFDESESTEYANPTGTSRTYTMMPMYGLEYDHGSGYFPVNDYWDHGMPSDPANPIRVTTVRQSSSFEAQNLEINLLRLGVCGGGAGPGAMSACYGGGACGGCDGCAGGCYGGCSVPRGSRYSCTAVAGFRWMQFDENFMFGVDYTNPAWPTPSGYLRYWSVAENNLIGAQIGCNGMYRIGCKWGLHCNTLVGLFGNDVDVRQYFVSPTGAVRFIGTGENFDVNASKTDVSMLGELRLGASYQATCHCRLYGGWRAIGVSGLALATDQTPNAFLSAGQMANYVNSNGSMILHGLQAGLEWNY